MSPAEVARRAGEFLEVSISEFTSTIRQRRGTTSRALHCKTLSAIPLSSLVRRQCYLLESEVVFYYMQPQFYVTLFNISNVNN